MRCPMCGRVGLFEESGHYAGCAPLERPRRAATISFRHPKKPPDAGPTSCASVSAARSWPCPITAPLSCLATCPPDLGCRSDVSMMLPLGNGRRAVRAGVAAAAPCLAWRCQRGHGEPHCKHSQVFLQDSHDESSFCRRLRVLERTSSQHSPNAA